MRPMRRDVLLSRVVLIALLWSAGGAAAADTPSLTGIWQGTYSYPAEMNMPPVDFTMIIVQEGKSVAGIVREKNTFGDAAEPWLHANLHGEFDATDRTLAFTKTYDGTANVGHDVKYTGKVTGDGAQITSGVWNLNGSEGTFRLNKNIEVKPGHLSGVWNGTQSFAAELDRKPVRFTLVVIQQDGELVGFTSERPSDGETDAPWLHATVTGRVRDGERRIEFKKRFDGTAVRKDVIEFQGELDDKRESAAGTWGEGDNRGKFTLERPLNSE